MPKAERLFRLMPGEEGSLPEGQLILLSGVVGVVAGLGAVAFQVLCNLVVHYGLRYLAGHAAEGPAREGELFAPIAPLLGGFSPWMLLAVITAGGLISGLLVYTFAPEAEGHGTDAAILAYHRKRGRIRSRTPIIKMITAAVTIGTGGSGGREGPIAQIGAGFGSFLGMRLRLSAHDTRILLAAGLGAGVAAIFRAPLAGAIFVIEVLYREVDFEFEALIPAFVSTCVAYSVFGMVMKHLFGVAEVFEPLFHVPAGLKFDNPVLLGPLTVLAAAMVAASWVYVRCFYGVHGLFRRLRVPRHVKPALGALAAGLVGVGIYAAVGLLNRQAAEDSLSVLSFGYGVIQKALAGEAQYGFATGIVLLLVVGFGKILTTSLTISSGGSGGVFGPSMVIGGTLGAVVGLVFQRLLPSLVTRVDMFVILGMASFFAAAAKTPVSTLIMVSEITGSYELLMPAMWVCALAYLPSMGWTIYHEQVRKRADSPAHRGDFILDVLQGLTVRDAWAGSHREHAPVLLNTRLRDIVALVPACPYSVFPVVDDQGRYYGLFGLHDIKQSLSDSPLSDFAIAMDIADPHVEPLTMSMDLSDAMARFGRGRFNELPIVDSPDSRKVLGILRIQNVVAAYNTRLAALRDSGELEDLSGAGQG